MQVLIKKYRTERKISLRQLAKKTGISKSQLSDMENRAALEYLKKLAKVAKHLEVCTKDLFVNCCNLKAECDYKCTNCCHYKRMDLHTK